MAISSVVKQIAEPTNNLLTCVITYTKANAGDTIDVTQLLADGLTRMTPIKNILMAKAQVDLAGADDPLTVSGSTITFTTGTGEGRCIVVGTA